MSDPDYTPVDYLDDLIDIGEAKDALMEAEGVNEDQANAAIVEWALEVAQRYERYDIQGEKS